MGNQAILNLRISFHMACAFIALRDAESLSRRLARYNHHMSKARKLVLVDSSINTTAGSHNE